MRFLALLLFLLFSAYATDKLKKEIAHLLIVGFENQDDIKKYIKEYELGGVILFDRDFKDRNKTKNISSKEQLKQLTTNLKNETTRQLLICVDEEGGVVSRLKPTYGFDATPSAKIVSQMDNYMARNVYDALANKLTQSGINCNFAPVLDLAKNPNNPVIVKRGRSYSKEPSIVTNFASIAIDAMSQKGIIAVAKHFPGHGSSDADSHDGFVDVSSSWSKEELEPYKELIELDMLKMVMSAHIFNKKLDATYPATLSYNINTKLLREQLGFDGVLVSDDMQMGAIAKNYSLKDALTLAINSGVDMLIFGNQLSYNDPLEIIDTIYDQVQNGSIAYTRIQEANKRVSYLLDE